MTTAREAGEPRSQGWAFSVAGFRVSIPWNALLGVALIAVLWFPEFAATRSPVGQWVMAAVFAVLLTGSILLHELAHGVAARGFGYHVTGITLWAMGGYTTYRTSQRHGPGREAAIAVAGPLATLLVAAVAWFAASVVPAGPARDLLLALTWANALVGVFNLLPGSPLDGGAIVRAAVWAATGSAQKGQIVSGWVGRFLAVIILVSPLLLAAMTGTPPSLVLIAVGVMLGALLWTGASASIRAANAGAELRALPARDLGWPVVALRGDATVADAVAALRPQQHLLVLGVDGQPVGVVSPDAARAVPHHLWDHTPALTVTASLGTPPAVPVTGSAWDVLEACQAAQSRFVWLVAADGGVAGLVDTDDTFETEGA